MKTDLYRYFDADGKLLYVGISKSAFIRAQQHASTSAFFKDAAVMKIEKHETREAAERAELEAIRTENPTWNVIGKQEAARPRISTTLVLPQAPKVQPRDYIKLDDGITCAEAHELLGVQAKIFNRLIRVVQIPTYEIAPGKWRMRRQECLSWWNLTKVQNAFKLITWLRKHEQCLTDALYRFDDLCHVVAGYHIPADALSGCSLLLHYRRFRNQEPWSSTPRVFTGYFRSNV